MQEKRITYFTHDYEPDREAISKEVKMLFEHFSGNGFAYRLKIHDITSRSVNVRFSRSYVAYYNKLLPLGYCIAGIEVRHFGGEIM